MQSWQEESYRQKSLFVRLVLWTGVARDQKQAEYILMGVVGVCVLTILWSLFSGTVLHRSNDRVRVNDVQQNPNYEPGSVR